MFGALDIFRMLRFTQFLSGFIAALAGVATSLKVQVPFLRVPYFRLLSYMFPQNTYKIWTAIQNMIWGEGGVGAATKGGCQLANSLRQATKSTPSSDLQFGCGILRVNGGGGGGGMCVCVCVRVCVLCFGEPFLGCLSAKGKRTDRRPETNPAGFLCCILPRDVRT